MKRHVYLRAYMAGVTIPTMFLVFVLAGFCIVRFGYKVPVPIERIIVFPMALVPVLWGLWNMLHQFLESRVRIPLGVHGAILPLLIGPVGFTMTQVIGFEFPDYATRAFLIGLAGVMVIYYLVWKYFVRFFNELLGIG